MMEKGKYISAKQLGRVRRRRRDMLIKPNNNSADFIAPNFAYGCVAACSYCYVARHNDFGNPLTIFDNTDDIIDAIIDHSYEQPSKYPNYSNQQDTWQWVYDIGESTDMMSSWLIEDTNTIIRQLVTRNPAIKPSFATKLCSPYTASLLWKCPSPYRARIRASMMPQNIANIVELGTTNMKHRIQSMKHIWSKEYEVHINFSPIILTNRWVNDYAELMQEIDAELGDDYVGKQVKQQLKCEVIFLLHHEGLHESNMSWNPEAEELLWVPEYQELKVNKRGAKDILRYKMELKKQACRVFRGLLAKYMPYCEVRYIF